MKFGTRNGANTSEMSPTQVARSRRLRRGAGAAALGVAVIAGTMAVAFTGSADAHDGGVRDGGASASVSAPEQMCALPSAGASTTTCNDVVTPKPPVDRGTDPTVSIDRGGVTPKPPVDRGVGPQVPIDKGGLPPKPPVDRGVGPQVPIDKGGLVPAPPIDRGVSPEVPIDGGGLLPKPPVDRGDATSQVPAE